MIITNRTYPTKKPTRNRFSASKSKYTFILGALILVTLFSPLQAATIKNTNSTTQSKSLSLADAISRTFDKHPELQTFEYRIKAQQGKIVQANLSPRPEVALTVEDALGSGGFSALDSAQTTLSVSWILDQSLKDKRTAFASQGAKLIESERAIKQLETATQTARYFLSALSHQERQKIANRAITLAKSTVNEIKKRVKVGKTPLAELYLAEAELAKRKLLLVDLKHQLKSSLRQLAAQWGSTTPQFDSVLGSLLIPPEVISFDGLKSQLKHNPHLARYLSIERVKLAELNLAQEERNPQWKFTTGVRRYERTDDYGITAGISIPFGGSNRNQGRIAEVRAKISQNQSEANALRIRIETSLYIVYQQLEHSLHLGELLADDIIPKLELALIETHKAYELGKYSYLEWLAVQNDLLDAQSALLNARLSAQLNKVELERLTGAQITSPF